jgi:hypothetical protein
MAFGGAVSGRTISVDVYLNPANAIVARSESDDLFDALPREHTPRLDQRRTQRIDIRLVVVHIK